MTDGLRSGHAEGASLRMARVRVWRTDGDGQPGRRYSEGVRPVSFLKRRQKNWGEV